MIRKENDEVEHQFFPNTCPRTSYGPPNSIKRSARKKISRKSDQSKNSDFNSSQNNLGFQQKYH